MRARVAGAAVLLVLAACSSGSDSRAVPPSSATSEATTTTTAPTTTTTSTTVVPPVPAQPATATCPEVPARVTPDPARPRYELRVDVRPAEGVVDGDLTVRFTPDVATDRLVFRLWPNGPKLAGAGAKLDVGPVSLDGGAARPGDIPDPTTLVVPLGRELAAGSTVTASLPWRLALPGPVSDRIARIGDAVRLGSFFPILAWEPGRGWATEPPTVNFAEASSAPTADFDVRISAPADLQVVTSGVAAGDGRWQALAVRDIAISVGRFRMVTATVPGPAPVQVTVAVDERLPDDAGGYRDTVVRSIEDFGRRFGPYPWPSFTLAITPNLSGGIEYPMHVMQGPGTGGRTTPHEVAHQWFYALVGNDQGRDPWLDEGLATWGEARFLDSLAELSARPMPADAAGRTGARMRYWNGRSSYYRGVYIQGALAVAALGEPDRVDCALRHFVARNAFRTATPQDLLASLEVVFPDARAVLSRFGAI